MTPAEKITVAVVLFMGVMAFLWAIFFINPRDVDEACADEDWQTCPYCAAWHHRLTGEQRETRPKHAPQTYQISAPCPDCLKKLAGPGDRKSLFIAGMETGASLPTPDSQHETNRGGSAGAA